MPETIVLLAVLIVAGAFVLAPLRRPAPVIPEDVERDAAAVRHRVALEALRDVEADRRAGSLDERGYAEQLAEAEARAVATEAELNAAPPDPGSARPQRVGRRAALVAVEEGRHPRQPDPGDTQPGGGHSQRGLPAARLHQRQRRGVLR